MLYTTQERTRNFTVNSTIPCEGWLEFAILENTYRYHKIRYREIVPVYGEEPPVDREDGGCIQ